MNRIQILLCSQIHNLEITIFKVLWSLIIFRFLISKQIHKSFTLTNQLLVNKYLIIIAEQAIQIKIGWCRSTSIWSSWSWAIVFNYKWRSILGHFFWFEFPLEWSFLRCLSQRLIKYLTNYSIRGIEKRTAFYRKYFVIFSIYHISNCIIRCLWRSKHRMKLGNQAQWEDENQGGCCMSHTRIISTSKNEEKSFMQTDLMPNAEN